MARTVESERTGELPGVPSKLEIFRLRRIASLEKTAKTIGDEMVSISGVKGFESRMKYLEARLVKIGVELGDLRVANV